MRTINTKLYYVYRKQNITYKFFPESVNLWGVGTNAVEGEANIQ